MTRSGKATPMMLPESPGDVQREHQEHECLQAPRCSASSREIAGIMLLVSRDPLKFLTDPNIFTRKMNYFV